MSEFIRRESTTAAITKRAGDFRKGPAKSAMQDAQIIIESIPAADVAPVVHARIQTAGEGTTHWSECSACGFAVDPLDLYCRHCSAIFDNNGGEHHD